MTENTEVGPKGESRKISLPTLKEKGVGLGEEVRGYVREQVDLWRLVPSLALEANGRDRIHSEYAQMYFSKVYTITTQDGFNTHIDLNTGEFVEPGVLKELAQVEHRRDVPTGTVLSILAESPDSLDAVKLIEKLIEEGKADYSGDMDLVEAEEYRERVREDVGLEKPDLEKIRATLDKARNLAK